MRIYNYIYYTLQNNSTYSTHTLLYKNKSHFIYNHLFQIEVI